MTAAEALRERMPDILRRWEAAVRAEVPAAQDAPGPVLIDDLPELFAHVAHLLERQIDPLAADAPAAQAHGWQRRSRPGCGLAELVREYRLLRDGLLDALPELTAADRRIVLHAIDRGLGEAAHYFAALSPATGPPGGEERYRSVVNTVVDGIITIDEHAVVQTFNPAAERIFGYGAAEVIGRNIRILMPEPYRSEHDDYVRSYLATGVAKIIGVGREVVGLRKDGTRFPMDLAVSEFRMEGRRCFTGIVRDITERKQMEQELVARAEALEESNRGKDEFLAMLGHELRNPLAPIRASVELMRLYGVFAAPLVRAVGIIDRQTGHLTRIVDDLLDVARLTRGRLQIHPERVELGPIVAETVDAFRDTIAASGQKLCVSTGEAPLWVDADPTRLSQVVANLLQNAMKFTPAGGRIEVSAAAEAGQAVVRVRDTGAGIDPALLPHVFDLFRQGWRTPDGVGGLGLGLTLVRRLVDQHGGTIRASSAGVGQGSEFVMGLQLHEAPAGAGADDGDGPAAASPRRVLVVDDNVDAATSLACVLEVLGHAPRVAHHPQEAIDAALSDPPDLVLMDIGLPDMDGYAVARRLREDPRLAATPLIAITGYGQEEDKQRARAAGFNRHLTKPVDFAVLERVLAEFDDRA